MKIAEWTDSQGFLRRSLIRDSDSDPLIGIPLEVPPLSEVIHEIERELHNELMRRRLYTLRDVEKSGNALTGAILLVLRTKLINLYKEKETNDKHQ